MPLAKGDAFQLEHLARDLAQAIEDVGCAIFCVDLSGRVSEWNRKAEEWTGTSRGDALGSPFTETFVQEKARAEADSALAKAFGGEPTSSCELPLINRNGQISPVFLTVAPRSQESGGGAICISYGGGTRTGSDLWSLDDLCAPTFSLNMDGNVTDWNKMLTEKTGYSHPDMIGKSFVDLVSPESKDDMGKAIKDAFEGTQHQGVEFTLVTKRGTPMIMALHTSLRYSTAGEVIGVVGVAPDITVFRHGMNEVSHVADDLTRLIDTANAPIFGIDVEGCVTEWNQKAAEISGWTKEQTAGNNLVDTFITPDYRDEVNRVLVRALAGQEETNFEFPLYTRSGLRREILLNATTRRSTDGHVTGVIGVGQDISELRAITEEHKQIADDLSRLIETANAPIFGVSVDGLVTEWNKKAAQLSGFAKEETMHRDLVEDFITSDYKDKVKRVLTQACEGVESTNFEFPLITKHGTRIDILLNATTRRNARGQVIGVVGVGQEISELRQAINEASRIADDLMRLINTANAPIFGIDVHGNVTDWNDKAATISGWPKAETMGQPLVERFIHEAYRGEVGHVLALALTGKETANYEFPLFVKDGSRREILLNATTRRGADGEVIGVIGVGQDITELRAITAEQHRTADDLSRLIETANAPIFGVDVNGHVTEWNNNAAHISGYSKQETMDRPLVADFITEDYKEKVQHVLNLAMQGTEAANFEFPLMTKNGKRIDILLNATTRRNEKGEVTGVVGVGQDITNLREAMDEASRTADDLTRLIDTANAPIFGIDTEGLVTEWNQTAANLSGWSKADTFKKPLVQSYISPDYKVEVNRVLTNALAGNETANFAFPLFTKDSRRREILLNATTRRGADGAITGVIGVGQDITELQNITAEQQRVADDLSRLIDTANAPIFGVSINGRVTEWNKKAADLSGFTKTETMGQPLVECFITGEYQDQVQQVLDKACSGIEAANFEFPLVTKDGKRIDILLNATTRRNAQGQVTGVVGVGQDITYLRQVMNETTKIANDLTRVIDTANAPIFGIDNTGLVTEWNQKAALISGWQKSQTLGKPLEYFIHEDYREDVGRVLNMALNGIETANYEFPLFTKNNSRREILLNATTRRGADGEIIGVIGVGQDITELATMNLEKHCIADDLSRLIETANAPIFGVNIEGHVTEWNTKASTITGYSKEETMGRPLVDDFITEEYKDKVQAVLAQACEGVEAANFEFPLQTKEGNCLSILLNATTRRNASGQVTGVVGVGQEITELRQAMNQTQFIAEDLGRLIDTAKAPIFGIDDHGLITDWNEKTSQISGWQRSETMGKLLVEHFIHEDYREEVKNVLMMALQGQETPPNYEFPLFTRDGRRREILLNATTRRGAKGEITGVILVGQDITEIRLVMKEQHRIADDLSRLIETANAPIFGVSVDGQVTEWNKKAADLSEYSKSEALGKQLVQSYISEECQQQVQHVLNRACQGRETANFEFSLVTKSGRRIYILLNATTRRDASGSVIGVVGVGQDITELREATSHSKSVADDLTRLIDNANAPIFGIDVHGNVTEWNRMAFKITRFDKRSVLNKPLVESFIHVDQRETVQAVFDKALAGRETANFEFPLYTRTGEMREILLNATTRRGPDGEVVGVLGVGQDITELNIQRRAAEGIASDLARLIDTANAPIFGVDVQGNVKEWNRKAAELSGYTKDEIMGQRLVQSLVSEQYQHKVAYVLLKALGGEESSDFEFPLITKSGDQRDMLMNATAQWGAAGDVTGVIGVGHDFTEIRRMAAEHKNMAEDLERLVRSANAPIFGVDTNGRLTEWNNMAAALLGYTREEALGQPFVQNFIREECWEQVGSVIENACKGVETTHFECPLVHRNGGEVLVLLNAATRIDAGGRIIGMVGVGQDITRLREAMSNVQKVADDLASVIDRANAPILGIDTKGCVNEWNVKMADISHYTKAEMLGKHLLETFIHEEYRDDVGAVLGRALEGVETDNYEFPLFTKSGGRHEILFNATTRRGADGLITGVIGVGQDITKLRMITMEQERIADDLARLIDNANAPIFGVDTNGLITEWNRKAVEISGFTKQETVGQSLVTHFIHQVHRKSVQAVLDQALSSQEVGNFELMLYTKSSEQRDILLNATPRKGAQNEVIGVVCVGQDITDLNMHRREAERIAEDLSQLIDSANAPIFGVDKDMQITEWNGWVAKNSGFQKLDVLGNKLTDYIGKDFQNLVISVFQESVKGNVTSIFEMELATNTLRQVCLLMNATPRLSPQREIVGVICVGQDITNLKEIEQKKSSFMAMVSHELKSPLHGIIGLSNSLVDNAGSDSPMLKPLQLLKSCATRLLDMVSNIMDASVLVQDKKMRFSRDNVNTNSIVEEVLMLCQHAVDKRGSPIVKDGVKLINEVSGLPMIEGDSHRITQVIYNLVTNALKFTHAGHVRVFGSADDAKQSISFTVEDTGIGIAKENLARIFKPFDQEDQSEARRYDGLGLGLAICNEVAARHGGALSVESTKDKGSQFIVSLPYKMAAKPEDAGVSDEKAATMSSNNENTGSSCEGTLPICADEVHTSRAPSLAGPEEKAKTVVSGHTSGSSSCSRAHTQMGLAHPPHPVTHHGLGLSSGHALGLGSGHGLGHGSGYGPGLGSGVRDTRPGQDAISLKPPAAGPPKLGLGSGSSVGSRARKVYIVLSVDDDHVSQDVISATFGTCSFEVVMSMSGTECLEYMKTCQKMPDIILLDVMMPGINGLGVLVELRKNHTMLQLPIIMVSAKNSMTDVVKGLELYCNDWVHKPFDKQELLARVKTQLTIREMMENCLADSETGPGPAGLAVPAVPASPAVHFAPIRAQESKIAAEAQEENQRLESCIKSLESESRQLKHLLHVANMDKETLQADVNRIRADFDKKRAQVESLKDQEAQREAELQQLQAQSLHRQQQQMHQQNRSQRPPEATTRQPSQARSGVPAAASESWQAPSCSSEDKVLLQRLLYQNAHLMVEVRGRERMLQECQEQLQRQKTRLHTTELRCEQLNQAMVRLEVDNSFFNRPLYGGVPGMNQFR